MLAWTLKGQKQEVSESEIIRYKSFVSHLLLADVCYHVESIRAVISARSCLFLTYISPMINRYLQGPSQLILTGRTLADEPRCSRSNSPVCPRICAHCTSRCTGSRREESTPFKTKQSVQTKKHKSQAKYLKWTEKSRRCKVGCMEPGEAQK